MANTSARHNTALAIKAHTPRGQKRKASASQKSEKTKAPSKPHLVKTRNAANKASAKNKQPPPEKKSKAPLKAKTTAPAKNAVKKAPQQQSKGAPQKHKVGAADEPTFEELVHEESRIGHAAPEDGANKKEDNKVVHDLLANYMQQLAHIPLFTAQEELSNARELENYDLQTWRLILKTPKAVHHTQQETDATAPEAPWRGELDKLLQMYRKMAARSRSRAVPASSACDTLVESLAKTLRKLDLDNVVLDNVMGRMRREVWGRHVLDASPMFRLTHADLTEIEKLRGAALRIRNKFVRANLRLVISVARNFHRAKIPFIDLIQEGNVGLMKAVHRYDYQRGFRFSTYAHWWIRQSIERAIINKGSQVRLPVHVIDSRRQLRKSTAKLTQDLGRAPTSEELSKDSDIAQDKVEQILCGAQQQEPVSLDEMINDNDARKFLDLLRDDTVGVDEALIRENTHAWVRELLHMLNPIERDIIRRRFGMGEDTDQTLDEIGKFYNLSRERVRQIQAQGLQKMRRMCERREIS